MRLRRKVFTDDAKDSREKRMTKFTFIKFTNSKDIPGGFSDYVGQDIQDLLDKMIVSFNETCAGSDRDTILPAFVVLHALAIYSLIPQEKLKIAIEIAAENLVNSVKIINGQEIFDNEE